MQGGAFQMIHEGVAVLTFRVAYVHSLKEKRSIVSSMKSKVRSKYNVSVIEADHQDVHQSIVLALSVISTSKDMVESTLQNITEFLLQQFDVELMGEEYYRENY